MSSVCSGTAIACMQSSANENAAVESEVYEISQHALGFAGPPAPWRLLIESSEPLRFEAHRFSGMWWDERFIDFDGDVNEIWVPKPASTDLTATIALESDYIRYDKIRIVIQVSPLCVHRYTRNHGCSTGAVGFQGAGAVRL